MEWGGLPLNWRRPGRRWSPVRGPRTRIRVQVRPSRTWGGAWRAPKRSHRLPWTCRVRASGRCRRSGTWRPPDRPIRPMRNSGNRRRRRQQRRRLCPAVRSRPEIQGSPSSSWIWTTVCDCVSGCLPSSWSEADSPVWIQWIFSSEFEFFLSDFCSVSTGAWQSRLVWAAIFQWREEWAAFWPVHRAKELTQTTRPLRYERFKKQVTLGCDCISTIQRFTFENISVVVLQPLRLFFSGTPETIRCQEPQEWILPKGKKRRGMSGS